MKIEEKFMKLPEIRLGNGEEVIYALRTHPKVLFLKILAGVIVLTLAIMYAIYLGHMHEIVNYSVYGILAIAGIYFCAYPIILWWNKKYIITNRQIFVCEGVLMKKTHSSQLSKASDLNVERGILDRIFNCGTLVIFNSATDISFDKTTVTLHDIPDVLTVEHKIKDMVFEMRQG